MGNKFSKSNNKQCGQYVKNPLDIFSILETVLAHCSIKDLMACRQVSTFWCAASLKPMTSSAIVHISSDYKMTQFLNFLEAGNDVPKFFVNFQLSFVNFANSWIYQSFYIRVCPQVKMLKLTSCKFRTRDILKLIIFKFSANAEQLHLHYLTCEEYYKYKSKSEKCMETMFLENKNLKLLSVLGPLGKYDGISWIELLSNFPGLEVLNISNISMLHDSNEILSAIRFIRQNDTNKLKLKEIGGTHNAENIAFLLSDPMQGSGLNLKKLALQLRNSSADSYRAFMQILYLQRASLKQLTLTSMGIGGWDIIDCFTSRNHPRYIILEDLNELIIESGVFTSLEFLKFTPNLRKLVIVDWMDSLQQMLTAPAGLDGFKLVNCVELRIVAKKVTSEQKLLLIELMPNLKSRDFVFDPNPMQTNTDEENFMENDVSLFCCF